MRRKLAGVVAATALVFTGLFAPAVSAAAPTVITPQNATATQVALMRAPIVVDQVVGYVDHQPLNATYASQEIYRSDVPGACLTEKRYYPSAYVAGRLSSVILWVPTGRTYCNYMYVTNGLGQTWGTCINKNTWGYNFGAGFNDNTWIIGVRSTSSCAQWWA